LALVDVCFPLLDGLFFLLFSLSPSLAKKCQGEGPYISAPRPASALLLTANYFLTAAKHADLHAHNGSAPIRLANAAGAAEHIQLANAAAPLPLRGQASCKECARAQARRKE